MKLERILWEVKGTGKVHPSLRNAVSSVEMKGTSRERLRLLPCCDVIAGLSLF